MKNNFLGLLSPFSSSEVLVFELEKFISCLNCFFFERFLSTNSLQSLQLLIIIFINFNKYLLIIS